MKYTSDDRQYSTGFPFRLAEYVFYHCRLSELPKPVYTLHTERVILCSSRSVYTKWAARTSMHTYVYHLFLSIARVTQPQIARNVPTSRVHISRIVNLPSLLISLHVRAPACSGQGAIIMIGSSLLPEWPIHPKQYRPHNKLRVGSE
jgi:hypothetical protein